MECIYGGFGVWMLFEKEELLDVYKRGLCPNEFSLSVEKSLSALERWEAEEKGRLVS